MCTPYEWNDNLKKLRFEARQKLKKGSIFSIQNKSFPFPCHEEDIPAIM